MQKTKIEWCNYTWNPISGCLHGCKYCYARKITHRFCTQVWGANGGVHLLNEPQYFDNSPGGDFDKPQYIIDSYPFDFDPTYHRYRLDEPTKLKTPSNIFVCSMADLFGEWVPNEWIEEVFKACEAAPWHRYLFLTKNPNRYMELIKKEELPIKYPPNYWYGETATMGELYGIPKPYNHFVSIEPIMGEVFISPLTNIKWVIIGAESGNRKDKVIPKREWIENIVDQCHTAAVPVFLKNNLIPIVGEEIVVANQKYPWEMS